MGSAGEPCRCWELNSALGHEGHCCFLNDDRLTWRTDKEICHMPEQSVS